MCAFVIDKTEHLHKKDVVFNPKIFDFELLTYVDCIVTHKFWFKEELVVLTAFYQQIYMRKI